MNKSNIRFLGLASVSLFVALTPLACGSDDDDDNVGTSGTGGKASTGGKTSTGGTAGKNSTGGSVNSSGNANGGAAAGDDAGGAGGAITAPKARLRVVHASPTAPSVDVYLAGSTTVVAEDVAY